jgi:hypothetical protein
MKTMCKEVYNNKKDTKFILGPFGQAQFITTCIFLKRLWKNVNPKYVLIHNCEELADDVVLGFSYKEVFLCVCVSECCFNCNW